MVEDIIGEAIFENVEVVNGDNVVFDTVLPLKDESIDYYIETK